MIFLRYPQKIRSRIAKSDVFGCHSKGPTSIIDLPGHSTEKKKAS